jgi:hypothetical protein
MTLTLAQPDQLPASERDLRELPIGVGHLQLARQLVGAGGGGAALDHLRTLPSCLVGAGATPGTAGNGAWWTAERPAVAYVYDDRLSEYDAFFGVSRAGTGTRGVFEHSLLVAYRSLLEEGLSGGTRMSWSQWSALCATFHAMIALVTGARAGSGPVPLPVPEPPLLRWHMDPHRRWRIGHHVFFVLTQSLIIALNCFRQARADLDVDLAGRMLRLAARLLTASAAAFVFAGEFSAVQYHDQVRPSMEPPDVSAGFSGLLSPDHRYLVKLLGLLRPELRDLPRQLAPDHTLFVTAMGTAYEAHKYVCARFGGDRSPSLRMSDASQVSAVEVIQGLKLARTKLVRFPQ